MLARSVVGRRGLWHGLTPMRRLCAVAPSLTKVTPSTPTALPAAAVSPAESAAKPEEDTRLWPVRNWKGLLFASIVGAWVYSMWVGNRTSKLRDDTIATVRDETPANPDELLELRALNDAPTSALVALPAVAAKKGCSERASRKQVLDVLQHALGSELREAYVLERMLMAMTTLPVGADPATPPPGSSEVDVRLAAASLMFLSSGPVRERLEGIFAVMQEPTEHGPAVSAARLDQLLATLMATGQVPPEQQVRLVEGGAPLPHSSALL